MRGLKDYIIEAFEDVEVMESANKIFRVSFKDLDIDKNIYYSIESLSLKKGIYYEKLDNGFKIKIKEGDEDKLDGYIDILNDIIAQHEEDENQVPVEYLQKKVIELMDIANGEEDEEAEDEKPEEGDGDEKKENEE